MKKELSNLLSIDGKDWHEANNDLLLLALMFEKQSPENRKINKDFYINMLGNDLFEYQLTRKDRRIITGRLEEMIKSGSSFSAAIAGILGKTNDEKVYAFLWDQLRKKYRMNPALGGAILRSINCGAYPDCKTVLEEITGDASAAPELREEARDKLLFLFSKESRRNQ